MDAPADPGPEAGAFDAIVLAGGRARRFGADKLAAVLDGRSVLERALDATLGAATVVCVGPRRPVGREVVWTREEPPGSGPVPAVAAGLDLVRLPWVLLLGGDMPDAAPGVPALRAAAGSGHSPAGTRTAYVAVSADGRLQPLLSWWPTHLLRERVAAVLPARRRSLTALTDGVTLVGVSVEDATVKDVDTPQDLTG